MAERLDAGDAGDGLYVVGSADGVNWLAERFHTAWDHRFEINGNVIVGVHYSGEIRRFVIPEH